MADVTLLGMCVQDGDKLEPGGFLLRPKAANEAPLGRRHTV